MHDLASEIAGKEIGKREIIELAGAPAGSTVRVTSYKESSLIVSVNSRTYTFSGQLVRSPDESLILKMDAVTVAKARRGQGIGRDAFARQLEESRKLGVDKIVLDGVRNDDPRFLQVGYKVWPKFGFDGRLEPSRAASVPKSLQGAKMLSDLRATAEGRQW
jgi:GNAT superfamily N-acetyltransferase